MNKQVIINNLNTSKKNCVIGSVGDGSLHRQLCYDTANFDLHLLVYDDTYNKYLGDSKFVCKLKGYKMDMSFQYFQMHPQFIEQYDYFLLLDDDIQISVDSVNKLFELMKEYRLKIAQPSLSTSYYTYEHTLHNPMCTIRYTNFVEMMMPCFSREALMAVMGTFEDHVRWCGIEYHWPLLINSNKRDIAIVDSVQAVHTRPVQTITNENYQIMLEYLQKNKLKKEIAIYMECTCSDTDYEDYKKLRKRVDDIIVELTNGKLYRMLTSELVPVVCFFCLYSMVSEKRIYLDMAKRAVDEIYFKHRADIESSVTEQEIRKLSVFVDYLRQYDISLCEIMKFLPEVDKRATSFADVLAILNINDDYVDTDVMDSVKKGVKICLELLTEEKYKYKFF